MPLEFYARFSVLSDETVFEIAAEKILARVRFGTEKVRKFSLGELG